MPDFTFNIRKYDVIKQTGIVGDSETSGRTNNQKLLKLYLVSNFCCPKIGRGKEIFEKSILACKKLGKNRNKQHEEISTK